MPNLLGPTYSAYMPRGDPPSHWVDTDLAALAKSLRDAQEKFFTAQDQPVPVRSLVLDSWRRSLRQGVDPGSPMAPVVLDGPALQGAREQSPLASALPMIRSLLVDPAGASGHVVAIGDAEGRLLWVEGDRVLRAQAEAIGFVPGSLWSESAAGTNAPGTALAIDAPVQIFASEHYRGGVQPWSCTAVPIHDPHTMRVLGVLDVTGRDQVATPQALAMMRATAMAVEQWLATNRAPTTGLQVLGVDRAILTRDGTTRSLSRRHSEMLYLLTEHPKGLTGERMAVMLHEFDVSLVTVRAEMARLRKIVGEQHLLSRPYRLAEPWVTDAAKVDDALDRGDVRAAVGMYAGPILPSSESPEIAEIRGDLRARVRKAALHSQDVQALLRFSVGEDGRDDVEVLTAALALLPPKAPQRIGVLARLERLNAMYRVPSQRGRTPGT